MDKVWVSPLHPLTIQQNDVCCHFGVWLRTALWFFHPPYSLAETGSNIRSYLRLHRLQSESSMLAEHQLQLWVFICVNTGRVQAQFFLPVGYPRFGSTQRCREIHNHCIWTRKAGENRLEVWKYASGCVHKAQISGASKYSACVDKNRSISVPL